MSRVFIRFAVPRDVQKLVSDGVLTGATASGSSWEDRAKKWLAEQQAGRRLILVAEDAAGLVGMLQIVFKMPDGYNDPEAANGVDIAMIESLRMRAGAQSEVADRLLEEVQSLARKRNVKTITFLVPMNQNRAVTQAKSWGFEEFRIMPEKNGMLAFFRKNVE